MLRFEETLDKWYLDLPEHLHFDPASLMKKGGPSPPPPHVLTLHAGYWSAVILLHRPFIRYVLDVKSKEREDPQLHAISQKNYDLCVQAANHITSIVNTYQIHFCMRRGSVFLSYYIFTAAIMHVITLSAYPDDPQARRGLTALMEVLKLLDTVWPSAIRAWELLHGSKVNLSSAGVAGTSAFEPTSSVSGALSDRLHKRSVETFLADDARYYPSAPAPSASHVQPSLQYGQPMASSAPQHGSPIPPGHTPSYYATPSSWPNDGVGPFSGNLSTSGMPQQYSTGFIDRPPPLASSTAVPSHQHPRFPQFWNDYSTLSPLSGVPYGGGQSTLSRVPAQATAAHLYPLQDQYQMFGASLPPEMGVESG